MPEPFLSLRHLVKTFDGHRAVDDVSIDIARGEVFALLGASGCGKTTLLRMLAGFETPTSGSIALGGRDLAGMPPYARPMNMMFQSYALFPHLTVEANVAFGLKREGVANAEISKRVKAMLELVQLGRFGGRKPHQLSGGQQQRVALARSLVKKPQLLLLDEPLGALDKKLREETQVELSRIIQDVGVTCVLVTHDQEEAMTMASRIAVMREGRFLHVATPAEIYERPADRYVADFIGDVNLIDGVATGEPGEVDCGDFVCRVDAVLPVGRGGTATVAVRPEKIGIEAAGPGAAEASAVGVNAVVGTVRDLAYFGRHTMYHLQLASGRVVKVSRGNVERDGGKGLSVGDRARASWPSAAALVYVR